MSDPEDYFPEFGDRSYDVAHYELHLRYDVGSNQLHGRADLEAVALVEVDELHLDLRGFRVTKVRSNQVTVAKFSVKKNKLVVRTKDVLEPGEEFTLSINYSGRPKPIPDGTDEMGWEELTDGVLVAGQTNGAPSWFPCNDRPSNKSTYRLHVTTSSEYHVVANGRLVERHRGASATTWLYEQPEPMATYLCTLQIGRYIEVEVPGAPVPLTAVLPAALRSRYDGAFGRQPEMLDYFSRTFGPYPFAGYSVVITDDELEIPLESQGLSVFGSNFLPDEWDNVRLVAHEMSHQWFGNSLTLTSWKDIWLHEGFACYSEWLWSEKSGSRTAQERALEHWGRLAELPQDLQLGDPGPDDMFDDRVYKRGALLLHALRLIVGDDQFFALLRSWVDAHAYGSVTTEMFTEHVQKATGRDLKSLFTAWLDETDLPPLPDE